MPLTISRMAPPDTVLGPIRDLVMGRSGMWLAASGSVPLAYYDTALVIPKYPITSPTGPFPLRAAYSLDVDEDGHALVWDGLSGGVLRVKSDGDVASVAKGQVWIQILETPGADYLGGKRNQVLALTDGVIVGRMDRSGAGSGDFDRLAFVRLAGDGRDTVLRLSPALSALDSVMTGPKLFAPFPLVARCGRGALAVYQPSDQSVVIYDSSWRVSRRVAVSFAPSTITPEIAKELFIARAIISANGKLSNEEVRRHMDGVPMSALRATARRMPAYAHLLCTPSGRILLEHFTVGTAGVPHRGEWEVHPRDGAPVNLLLPAGFRLFDASDDILVGVMLDSLDIPRVAIARWP